MPSDASSLFQPFSLKSLTLKNRFVMAPMTRAKSPNGIPGQDVAAYYRRRAEGDVGLILSEGTVIERPASAGNPSIPHFYGVESLAGWKHVIEGVHAMGGKMGPQIWHVGVVKPSDSSPFTQDQFEGPSGYLASGDLAGKAMTEEDIAEAIDAYGRAARSAKELGFDMVELHGAHGYLIDQFFWDHTNKRSDGYGGADLAARSRFGTDVVKSVRKAVGEDFVVCLRISQWKLSSYETKLAATPDAMAAWLQPLADAGVDLFHCSQRRFWEPEFEGSDLNFAGWAKKLTGKPSITVGSIGLSGEFMASFKGESSTPTPLDELTRRLDRGDFDLVAIGRVLISDPQWVRKLEQGREDEFVGFNDSAYATLV